MVLHSVNPGSKLTYVLLLWDSSIVVDTMTCIEENNKLNEVIVFTDENVKENHRSGNFEL